MVFRFETTGEWYVYPAGMCSMPCGFGVSRGTLRGGVVRNHRVLSVPTGLTESVNTQMWDVCVHPHWGLSPPGSLACSQQGGGVCTQRGGYVYTFQEVRPVPTRDVGPVQTVVVGGASTHLGVESVLSGGWFLYPPIFGICTYQGRGVCTHRGVGS